MERNLPEYHTSVFIIEPYTEIMAETDPEATPTIRIGSTCGCVTLHVDSAAEAQRLADAAAALAASMRAKEVAA